MHAVLQFGSVAAPEDNVSLNQRNVAVRESAWAPKLLYIHFAKHAACDDCAGDSPYVVVDETLEAVLDCALTETAARTPDRRAIENFIVAR